MTLAGPRRLRRDHLDATPERLARAGEEGGTAAVDGAGVRRLVDAFDALRDRGLLDRLDVAGNEVLWHAGDRLRRLVHRAQLDGPSTLDLGRPCVDGGAGGAAVPGEAARAAREALRRAGDAVGPRLMPYLQGVVVEGRSLASLRPLVRDTGHARTADALALERLREALHRLCGLWGMRANDRPLPIAAWREGPEEAAPG